MKGERTGIEFEQHELIVFESNKGEENELIIHHLKKPNSYIDSIKFINTNGILSVTGDYSNWIFCREFVPSVKIDNVCDMYWKEKLINSSCQEPSEFDSEGTVEDINTLLAEEEDLSAEETEYLKECLSNMSDGELDYTYFAHRNNCGRFEDHEYVPLRKTVKYHLLAVFDGFDEICRRLKLENKTK